MSEHLSHDDVHAFLDGRMPRPRVEQIGAHVASCDACAARLGESEEFASAADALWDDEPARNRLWVWAAIAAVVLIAIVGALLLRKPRQQQLPRIVAKSYGRPDWDAAVREATTTRRLATPAALASLRGSGAMLRGRDGANGVRVVAPVGVFVATTQPTFRWTMGAAAQVVVAGDDGNVVLESPPQRGDEWTADRPLAAGGRYRWQLRIESGATTTIVPPPDQPPARFVVVDAAASADVAAARANGDPLLLAVVLARHGVVDEADAVLRRMPASPLVESLRASLQPPAPTSANADQ